jgi:hypothetical protein
LAPVCFSFLNSSPISVVTALPGQRVVGFDGEPVDHESVLVKKTPLPEGDFMPKLHPVLQARLDEAVLPLTWKSWFLVPPRGC